MKSMMGGSMLPCRGQEAPQSALPAVLRKAAALSTRACRTIGSWLVMTAPTPIRRLPWDKIVVLLAIAAICAWITGFMIGIIVRFFNLS